MLSANSPDEVYHVNTFCRQFCCHGRYWGGDAVRYVEIKSNGLNGIAGKTTVMVRAKRGTTANIKYYQIHFRSDERYHILRGYHQWRNDIRKSSARKNLCSMDKMKKNDDKNIPRKLKSEPLHDGDLTGPLTWSGMMDSKSEGKTYTGDNSDENAEKNKRHKTEWQS